MLDAEKLSRQSAKKRVKNGHDGGSRKDTIDNSIIHLLHRASQRASEIFVLETRGFDLTARQYAVITTISRHEGLSQTDLVRLTGIDRSTLADVVQRLLKRGIIQRERTPKDGRTYSVSLSPEGRQLLQSIKPIAKRADRTVKSLIQNEDEQVIQALERLIKHTENEVSGSSSNGQDN